MATEKIGVEAQKGFTVKSAAAMDNLVQAGARAGASMADVAERSEIVLTCLPASPDVEALYLEPGKSVEGASWVGRTEAEAEIVASRQRRTDAIARGEKHL